MVNPPARAHRGDPDMTRRLLDRVHVRRPGQTRCRAGQSPSTTTQLADFATHTPVCAYLCPVAGRQLLEPTGGVQGITAPCWSTTRQLDTHSTCPRSQAENGQCSSNTTTSDSSVPIVSSPSQGLHSCSTRPSLSPPQHRLKDEKSAISLLDDSHTACSRLNDCKLFERVHNIATEPNQRQTSLCEAKVLGSSYEQNGTSVKHRRHRIVSTSLLILYLLLLVPRYILAKPASASELEKPHSLILKTPLCKPVSHEDLQRMMGTYFDPSRMAADMDVAKRNQFLPDYSSRFGHSSAPGFQGDDPRASRMPESDDLVQEEILWTSDEDDQWEDDESNGEMNNERVWVKEKETVDSISNNGEEWEETIEAEEEIFDDPRSSRRSGKVESVGKVSGRYKHKHRQHRADVDESREYNPARQRVFTDSYAYMKKRRRKRSPQTRSRSRDRDAVSRPAEFVNRKYNASGGFSNNNSWTSDKNVSGARRRGRYVGANNRRRRTAARDNDNVDDENDKNVSSRSDDVATLPLRIAMSRKNKERRKLLKQKFRQNAKYLSKRRPPWECKMTSQTLIMREGVFPRILVDGTCGTNRKCFYRLYDCKSQYYNIKLMQRDPNHCNPLPTVGNTTVFEERWNLKLRRITVGCNCVNAPIKRKKSKNSSRRRTMRKKTNR